jgi:ArsR family transcriptional regulator
MASPARQPDALLSWMEGLADATRLRLLRLLERQELGVAEICEVLQIPQSTASRHLKVLAEQGWVASRPHRTTNLYRMALKDQSAAARRLWLLVREQTEGWATVQQDRLRLERLLARRTPAADSFFAGAASHWDRLRAELYGEGFTQQALLALLPPEWVVADLGCGTGHTTTLVSPHVARVIGVDRSAAMLKTARRRTAGLDNVDLRQGELEAIPIADATCDAALLVLVLAYVEEPAAVLRETARILRPGGRAVIVDLLRHDREEFRLRLKQRHLGWESAELRERLAEAGLRAGPCRPLPPEPKAKGPALILASATRP